MGSAEQRRGQEPWIPLPEQRRLPLDEEEPLKPEGQRVAVLFRRLTTRIPSTTYGSFGLYRYPAKFIPQVIAYILERYGRPGMSVIDPFAGSGTTGLVARLYGLHYEMWDLNPMLQLLHDVATFAPPHFLDIDALVSAVRCSPHRFRPLWRNLHYWFPEPVLEVLERAFGHYHHEDPLQKHLLAIPLLKVMRAFSYNDPQRQKLSRSPVAFRRVAELMEGDWQIRFYTMLRGELMRTLQRLQEYQHLSPQPVQMVVRAGIDGIAYSAQAEGEWDLLITSPPYLQAQEYIRNSKLDLVWLGYGEEQIRALARCELPYRAVEPIPIHSPTYRECWSSIAEDRLRRMFERYFWAVLTVLGNLAPRIRQRMFLFVGPASIRSHPIPVDQILVEHFVALGWQHEVTLVDSIVARVMFRSRFNPATGLEDRRMPTEHLVILRRRKP